MRSKTRVVEAIHVWRCFVSFDRERDDGVRDGSDDGDVAAPAWRRADRALRALARRRAALDVDEARWLLEARRAKVHEHLGLGSFVEYCERVLGYRPRTTMERLRVAEAIAELPETRDALGAGELSYSAVRELTRVATPETVHDWIDAARDKTVREIESMVAGRAPGDRPTDAPDPSLELRRLALDLEPQAYALLLEALRHVRDRAGSDLSDSDAIVELCEDVLAGVRATPDSARHQIALTQCTDCKRTWQDGGGQVVEVAPAVIDAAACDATVIDLRDPASTPTRAIPRAVRTRVLRRDHNRCTVPGCRSARHLDVHHITPRAAGGDHAPDNLTVLCGAHHRALHAGRLRIEGRAPELRFTHEDGRSYGSAAPSDRDRDAMRALRQAGYPAKLAADAVARAVTEVGPAGSLEALLVRALRHAASLARGG